MRVRATGEHLAHLLSETPAYRSRWQRHARRLSDRAIHQGAVAQVLADHLWESGEVPEVQTDLPRQLKDTVSRALAGKALSPQTLRTFIDAFEMNGVDAAQLWSCLSGAEPTRLTVVRDNRDGQGVAPDAPGYRTVSVHDFHHIGPEGLPSEHRTVQIVRAMEPTAHVTHRFDTNAVAIEVLRGGSPGGLYTPEPGLHAVDITLDSPLAPGQTASLEYRTLFSYRSAPPPEFRRAARRRMENVELHLQFHPDRVPERVWWGVWDHLDGPTVHEEPVELNPALSVHRFLDRIENVTVGFHWEWR